jgi:hypothetical protein
MKILLSRPLLLGNGSHVIQRAIWTLGVAVASLVIDDFASLVDFPKPMLIQAR